MKKLHPQASIRGNALWFILIAIFLLAALTMLITRTSSQTEETGDVERLNVAASQAIRYAAGMQATVTRMLSSGVGENQISFANTTYKLCNGTTNIQGPGHNPNCTKPDCEIFNVAGGGLTPQMAPEALRSTATCTWWQMGAAALNTRQVLDVGTAANDLTLEIYGITREACIAINRILGITNPGGAPPVENDSSIFEFTGSYSAATGIIGDEVASLRGKKSFCLERAADNDYHFYTVLIPR